MPCPLWAAQSACWCICCFDGEGWLTGVEIDVLKVFQCLELKRKIFGKGRVGENFFFCVAVLRGEVVDGRG